jgi:integrase/recombinase XerD
VRTLKAFGSWLREEGIAAEHPFERLKSPKLPQTVIEILSDEEISRLLDSVNPNTPAGARTQLILLLLLDTGIRASEQCGLTLDPPTSTRAISRSVAREPGALSPAR